MYRLCILLLKLFTFNLRLSYSQNPLSNIKLEILELREFFLTQLFVCFDQVKVFLAQKRVTNQISGKLFRNWLLDRLNKTSFVCLFQG